MKMQDAVREWKDALMDGFIIDVLIWFHSAEEGVSIGFFFFYGYKPDKFPMEFLVILAPFFFRPSELGYQTSS